MIAAKAKLIKFSIRPSQEATPRKRLELSEGSLPAVTGLLFPVAPVKPFAHAVGDYVRCDRHKKTD